MLPQIVKLPIGVSDFSKLVTYRSPLSGVGYLFVDKTLFIRELLEDATEVIVITRPRRFGKTLNLSMLQCFFAAEVDGIATCGLFNNLKIASCPDCMQLQGKYPVIFLSLKDIKADNYESAINNIYEKIREVYEQHRYIMLAGKISQEETTAFGAILNKTANKDDLIFALRNLSHYLYKTLGQQVYILVDEYDTPIQESYINGYYEKLIVFIRVFLGSALKGNANLRQAVLTGVLRVAKESLFSDLNNVEIYSVLHNKYAEYFGFTEEEVTKLLVTAKLSDHLQQAKEWYNGYNFGVTTVYNPWSIIKFIKEQGQLMSYWINTSGNTLVKDLIITADPGIKVNFQDLIMGKSISVIIDEHIVFGDLAQNATAMWSLLLMAGYLKVESKHAEGNHYLCELKIPNQEVAALYRSIVQEWLSGTRGFKWYQDFLYNLTNGNIADFAENLQAIVDNILSYHDVTKVSQEYFYHGLMLGIVVGLKDTYEIKSNKESGKGRYDILLIPRELNKLGIVMEFKATEDENALVNEAQSALEQITRSNYITELQQRGVINLCKIGVAFAKKALQVNYEILGPACGSSKAT